MKNQVLRDYLFHVLPAIGIPLLLYLSGENIPVPDLIKIGLLFPLFLLAMKGLTTYFPVANAKDRSIGRMAEFAILQGAVFASAMVLFNGFMHPHQQSDLFAIARQFALPAVFLAVVSFATAYYTRKKLRLSR